MPNHVILQLLDPLLKNESESMSGRVGGRERERERKERGEGGVGENGMDRGGEGVGDNGMKRGGRVGENGVEIVGGRGVDGMERGRVGENRMERGGGRG